MVSLSFFEDEKVWTFRFSSGNMDFALTFPSEWKSALKKDEIELLERRCSEFGERNKEVFCEIRATVGRDTFNLNIVARKERDNAELALGRSDVFDVPLSIEEVLDEALACASGVVGRLLKMERSIWGDAPKTEQFNLFPHARKCFELLINLGIGQEDAAKVIYMSGQRILESQIPLTDEDYSLIYKDLTTPISWQDISSLVNLFCERADMPIPTNKDEYTERLKTFKEAILTIYPQFADHFSKYIRAQRALYYFIKLKILDGTIRKETTRKEDIQHGTQTQGDWF